MYTQHWGLGMDKQRCAWVGNEPLMQRYHDEEWGVPVHDDRLLFEFLVLEGAQAGLSWRTILLRREAYRRAFDGFDLTQVAAYGPADMARLLADQGIIRNRLKIQTTVTNAQRFMAVQQEFGSFDAYIWGFTGGRMLRQTGVIAMDAMPATTMESEAMSKNLKWRGFKFVGPTICYAFMQAVGIVNDHVTGCFRAP